MGGGTQEKIFPRCHSGSPEFLRAYSVQAHKSYNLPKQLYTLNGNYNPCRPHASRQHRPARARADGGAGLGRLERKARRPQDFVPVVESCEILSETAPDAGEGGRVIRAVVVFKPDSGVAHALRISETCTLRPPCRLDYDMDDGSTAVNIVSSSADGELFLTFVFAWSTAAAGT